MSDNKNYVKLPVDFYKIRDRWFGAFTKRQCKYYVIALLCGLPWYFILYFAVGTVGGIVAMFIFSVPALICSSESVYEKKGVYFNEFLLIILKYHRTPKKRIFISRNALEHAMLIRERMNLRKMLKDGTQ
jgi:hypothetical protein